MYRNTSGCFSVELPMMRVPMQNQIGSVTIYDLC